MAALLAACTLLHHKSLPLPPPSPPPFLQQLALHHPVLHRPFSCVTWPFSPLKDRSFTCTTPRSSKGFVHLHCEKNPHTIHHKCHFEDSQYHPPLIAKHCAFLLAPLASAFFLASAATALSVDLLPSESLHMLQGLPLADLDPSTARLVTSVLGPIFASFNLLFIVRIVMSWYPQLPVDKFPYVIAFAPTEPVLGPTRRVIPPVGGVDVSPVIWVAILSFLNEILLGQQGLLVLLSQQQT